MTMVIGFAGTIATQVFLRWQTAQALKKQALDIQQQAQETAKILASKTESTAKVLATKTDQALQAVKDSHDSLLAAQKENTRLTIIGNDIKADILKNQDAIEDSRRDISQLKEKVNGS